MSKADVGKTGGDPGSRGRFSSKQKLQTVLRLLQGESLDTLSRELKVNADTLSAWRDSTLNASLLELKSRPSFVRAPEGNSVAGQFIRTLKEQLLWIETFETVEDLRLAMQQRCKRYNAQWLVQQHGHCTPEQVRQVLVDLRVAAQLT